MENTPSCPHADRYKNSIRLVNYALKHEPDDIYEEANKPLPSKLHTGVAMTIKHKIENDDSVENKEVLTAENTLLILSRAIEDMTSVIDPYVREASSKESILEIIANERTIRSMAAVALNTDTLSAHYVGMMYSASKLSDTHIALPDGATPSAGARVCPAPYPNKEQRDPFQDPVSPLFKKCIIWSGALAVASYEDHGLTKF